MISAAEELRRYGAMTDARLSTLMELKCEPGTLKDAMSYSLIAGGKRLRPALCLMTADMFGSAVQALDIACTLEMIHTYSLIHDDLPCMDNDVLRRGKPTNHVVFGEAYAVLAGDGLLNLAFEVMLDAAVQNEGDGLNYLGAMHVIASAAGVRGMIEGQACDIAFEGQDKDEEVLRHIHERKTGAMIRASVLSAAALFRASEAETAALTAYGEKLGLVFQIVDDILDEVGDEKTLGKSVGKDADAGKQTFARIYGIEASKRIARDLTREAQDALRIFGPRASGLASLAQHLLTRDR
jgi:geranylgeranyl diphosphate synthase type II